MKLSNIIALLVILFLFSCNKEIAEDNVIQNNDEISVRSNMNLPPASIEDINLVVSSLRSDFTPEQLNQLYQSYGVIAFDKSMVIGSNNNNKIISYPFIKNNEVNGVIVMIYQGGEYRYALSSKEIYQNGTSYILDIYNSSTASQLLNAYALHEYSLFGSINSQLSDALTDVQALNGNGGTGGGGGFVEVDCLVFSSLVTTITSSIINNVEFITVDQVVVVDGVFCDGVGGGGSTGGSNNSGGGGGGGSTGTLLDPDVCSQAVMIQAMGSAISQLYNFHFPCGSDNLVENYVAQHCNGTNPPTTFSMNGFMEYVENNTDIIPMSMFPDYTDPCTGEVKNDYQDFIESLDGDCNNGSIDTALNDFFGTDDANLDQQSMAFISSTNGICPEIFQVETLLNNSSVDVAAISGLAIRFMVNGVAQNITLGNMVFELSNMDAQCNTTDILAASINFAVNQVENDLNFGNTTDPNIYGAGLKGAILMYTNQELSDQLSACAPGAEGTGGQGGADPLIFSPTSGSSGRAKFLQGGDLGTFGEWIRDCDPEFQVTNFQNSFVSSCQRN